MPDPLQGLPGIRSLWGIPSTLPAAADEDSYDMQYLRSLLSAPGQARLLVPPEELPEEWKP